VKKKKMLVIGVGIVLLLAGGLAYRTIAGNQAAAASEVQTATVERGSLTSTLSSSGNAYASQSATISWQTSGKVGDVILQPGDLVTGDQVLAELDPESLSTDTINAKRDLIDAQQALDDLLNSKLQQAQALQAVEDAQQALDNLNQQAAGDASQAQLDLANAQEAYDAALKTRNAMNYPHSSDELVIEKAQTDYLLAKEAYKEALKEFRKYEKKNLTNTDRVRALNNLVTAEQKMDTAFATYNWYLLGYTDTEIAQADGELAVAKANLDTAQAAWDNLKGGSSSGAIALAEANLADAQREWERVKDGPSEADIEAAQAAVDAAQATLDHTQLLAPFAGTVTEVDVSTGDLVSSGEAAFRIDDLSSLYVDLEISEVDLPSLKVGQQATLEFDAIADQQYSGEVTEIGMVGSVSQGVVNYPVTVRITDADENIRPGMTASVTVILDQRQGVLLVPNKAIHTSSGQQTVTVLFEGQQIAVPVTVGLVGDSQSEITSDQLREGDVLVISGSTASTATSGSGNASGGLGGFGGGSFQGGPPPGGLP
jgi:HlyD family secretion protein